MSPDITTPVRPTVTASFSGYAPPFEVVSIVRQMLDSVPEKYLLGLREVVLTNASGLPRKLRRSVAKSRGRKAKMADARGLYHREWEGKQAWIEIFVDNALKGWDRGIWLKVPFIRKGRIGDVLFHEIGHHIHHSIRPEFREKEDVADVWKVRLERSYFRQHHRLICSLVRFLHLGRFIDRLLARISASLLAKGSISRAEHEENLRDGKLGHS